MTDMVLTEQRETSAVIHLNNPPTNALCESMLNGLMKAMADAAEDGAMRVIILASKVRYAFCSGLDLQQIYAEDKAEQSALNTIRATERSREAARLIASCDKPVIAAINGVTIGSGVTLALSCDFRVCSDVAQFRLPDVQYGGLLGDGGIDHLRRIAGEQTAKELLLLGEKVRATRAHDLGLVNRIVPDGQELEEALALARVLSRRAPKSLAYCKKILNSSAADPGLVMNRLLYDIAKSADMFEGLRAFAEKREPGFEGR